MPAQPGRNLLLKIDSGSGFTTIAGLRARRIAFNAQAVDSTDAESAGRWRELLAGAGIRRASISGSGIFRDQASDNLLRSAFFNAVAPEFQVVIPDFGTVSGTFQITALEYRGSHEGEVGFELALESAGPISFTAAA
jgi:TP901-1 family phage major tail protein